MNLSERLKAIQSEVDEINDWANSEYDKYFAPYFKEEKKLYDRIKSKDDPITDSELEWILTDLPLELFSVSEQLGKLKISQEVIRIHIKQVEREYIATAEGSATQKKEDASALTAEDKLLVDVYDTIIERVNKQMTFSKELIMSAKKIWDARRADGIPLPDVVPNQDALPEYDFK